MTAKEAYVLLSKLFPKLRFISCYEYKTVFVFQFVSIKHDKNVPTDKLLNSLMSINKKTCAIRAFKPTDIPLDEFRAGKKITDFK